MRLRPLALGAALSAMAFSGALAQSTSSGGGGSGGAASSQRDLGFGAQVLVSYTDNAARAGKSVAVLRGLVSEDVTVTPTLSFRATQPIGQQNLFASGSYGYQFHQHNKVLDRATVALNGGGSANFGRCQATLTGSYQASQADIEDLDPLTTSNKRSSTRQGVALQCGTPSGLGGNIAVQRGETKNSERRLRLNDSDSQSISVGVGYSNSTLGTVGVNYSYDSNAFPNLIIPGRPIGDGYFNESIGVSAQRSFGRVSVDLAASRFSLKREFAPAGASAKLNGATYGGSVSYDLGTRISLTAGGSRSIRPSGRPGKVYDISKSMNAGIQYKLGSRIELSLDHTLAKTASNRDSLTPLLVITDARLSSTSAAILFTQSQKLTIGMTVRYDDRQTNLPQFDYAATSVGLRVGTSF